MTETEVEGTYLNEKLKPLRIDLEILKYIRKLLKQKLYKFIFIRTIRHFSIIIPIYG